MEQTSKMVFQKSAEYLQETFGLNEENVKEISDLANDYAVYKGLLKRTKDHKYVPIQFSLTPSRCPENYFNLIKAIQPQFNYVLHQVAHSDAFLSACFERSIRTDEFIARIWNVHKGAQTSGANQPINLGLLRCDYMLDADENGDVIGIKQIENNTMACAMSGVSPYARDIHEFVLDRLGRQDKISKLAPNRANTGVPEGMVAAWKLYGNRSAVILFVIEAHDMSNICDHKTLEFQIWNIERDIKLLRYTFQELHTCALLKDKKLFVDGKEVAIVYYRWGYVPSHYEEKDWELRLMMEKSSAIKCPTTGYHLAGTKRVQAELTRPGVLEDFLPPGADVQLIRQVFARQYHLSQDEGGNAAVSLALSNPNKYVLKPEREGGGNNAFGQEIVNVLNSIGNSEARQGYILMEKVNAPFCPTYAIKHNASPKLMNIVMEIGIYGVVVGKGKELCKNYETGYVVKSKEFGMDEGGLCSGFSYIDSPLLY